MKKYHAIIWLIVLAACKPYSSVMPLRSVEKDILSSEGFKNNFTGAIFYDLAEEKELLTINAEKYFTPASNIKLLTYFAASHILPDTANAMEYMQLGDSIIFWGTGDPTFLHPDFEYQPALKLLQDTTKQLYFYNKLYEGDHFGSGWAWDNYQSTYSTERAAFPIYANQFSISYSDTTDQTVVFPDVFDQGFSTRLDTSQKRPVITRDRMRNQFELVINEEPTDGFDKTIPFIYSPELFVRMLSDTLNKEIMQIDSLPTGQRYSVKGYPMDSIYQRMLQDSDNFFAEQVLIMSSNHLFDTLSTSRIIDYTKDYWWHDMPDPIRWVDGSGLSRYNLISPRDMVYVLEKLYDEMDTQHLFSLMAAGGHSGTLKRWYKPALASDKPYICAKSGTLSNNYCLSGYLITAKGRTLAFSVMSNHYMHGSSTTKRELEMLLEQVRDRY